MYSYREKQEIYKRWIANGRPWFHIDKSKEPSYLEKQVIMEMKEEENARAKYHKEIEKRTKHIRENYEKKGLLSDKVFDALDNY